MPNSLATNPTEHSEGRTVPTPASADNWFVVHHKPGSGQIAVRNLARQGMHVFSPYELVERRQSGKVHLLRKALFPGYIFVQFDLGTHRWRSVNSTFGVLRLVSFGQEYPAPVPGPLMASLQLRCDHDGKLLPPDDLASGELVKITAGPFSGYIGVVEKIDPQKRVWILMDLMGRTTITKTSAHALQRVSAG